MNIFTKLNGLLFPRAKEYERLGTKKALSLGFQHAFAMSLSLIHI